jgi:23S rRNA (cytosine1962-C5)-methyltransferase
MARVILKHGREESLQRRHPWVFSGAVQGVKGNPAPGETVDVFSSAGQWLAAGAWSPHSQIRVRIWSFSPGEAIGEDFIRGRLEQSIHARSDLLSRDDFNACRLVNAESDGLPGLIVDIYDRFLVCQFLSAGAECFRNAIVELLAELVGPASIFERSDTESRTKEGLHERCGSISGKEPPELIEIIECGARFLVDVRKGHKTGFYLDQRENRLALREYSRDAEVLNCFSYTGAFGISALLGGAARVTNVESSSEALALAGKNSAHNGVPGNAFQSVEGDVFHCLRDFRDRGLTFDLIVLDPPKFAASASQIVPASRGYKDINLLAFKLLNPGGTLFTFSCSGHISPALFQKIVADAALDARRDARIIRYLGQASDHPIALSFPEGQYLKGLVCTAP